jgi:hypothetical protein
MAYMMIGGDSKGPLPEQEGCGCARVRVDA